MTDEDVGADFAHPARVYDYWLGGTDNFPADRAAAEQVMRFMPEILDTVAQAGDLLDLGQPAGLLFVGCLHHIVDADDPARKTDALGREKTIEPAAAAQVQHGFAGPKRRDCSRIAATSTRVQCSEEQSGRTSRRPICR